MHICIQMLLLTSLVTSLILIDNDTPMMTDILRNVNEDTLIPIHELKQKTAAPISILTEQRAEELSWVQLFPNGKTALRENRITPISPLDYFQSKIVSHYRRF